MATPQGPFTHKELKATTHTHLLQEQEVLGNVDSTSPAHTHTATPTNISHLNTHTLRNTSHTNHTHTTYLYTQSRQNTLRCQIQLVSDKELQCYVFTKLQL